MENKRITHSVLDPFILPAIPSLYRHMHIPKALPPEAIVVIGHIAAIIAAVAFAFATHSPWAALIAAFGVTANHLADMVDGTHARSTGQCRNGGELLDHFFDPLSFAYWMVGLAAASNRLDLAIALVILIFATAVLTSIKAKMIGQFTLAKIGPTEFKTLLILFALTLTTLQLTPYSHLTPTFTLAFTYFLIALGAAQLIINLITSIKQVNQQGAPPDTTPWILSTTPSTPPTPPTTNPTPAPQNSHA